MPQDSDDRTEIDVDQAVDMALNLLRKRELDAAKGLLETIIENVPDHAQALNALGVLRFHTEGPASAASFLKESILRVPDHAGMYNNLGNAYVEMGKLDAAVDAYDRAIEIDPSLSDAYCNLASLMRRAGNTPFAEKLLRKAVDIHPEFGLAHNNLAVILLDDGRAREAIDHFWQATVHMPDKSVPAHFLALAYWFAGLKEMAVEFVKKWAETHPDDPQAQHMRASMTGEDVPERASDLYVRRLFDAFASSFDAKLESLDYKAPELVGEAFAAVVGKPSGTLVILDAGCGTGRCGKHLKPFASTLHGVDLSGRMLALAHKLQLYDDLVQGELTAHLEDQPGQYDAIISADTLCYFGRLEAFSAAAARALRPGGLLIFTVEALPDDLDDDFRLAVHGRYAHAERYVRACLKREGLSVEGCPRVHLRNENAEPVIGLLVTARKSALN
jgi:predicted TPR repeat methyltransferase